MVDVDNVAVDSRAAAIISSLISMIVVTSGSLSLTLLPVLREDCLKNVTDNVNGCQLYLAGFIPWKTFL